MSTFSKIGLFITGAIVGVVATQKYFKTKYEKIADEEIESVKTVMRLKDSEKKKKAEEPVDDADKYKEIVRDSGYSGKKKEVEKEVSKPYIIPPEEFDENGFQTEILTYFEDEVLVNEYGDVIDNVDELISKDSLEHFGEYENDSVFVRNEELETDFEIQRDSRNYNDVCC